MSALPPLDPGERDSFRAFLHALDRRGELARIATPFDPTGFDVSACLAALDDGPALLFAAADAAGIPLAGNVVNSIDRIALGLETSRAALGERIAGAIARPLAPTPAARAPVQDVEMKPDLDALPIPRFFEHETGPYITAGCIVARDAATGRGNVSFARLKPLGGARALIGIAPNHHLAVLARAAGERGQRLPIAVTLGNHPSVLVAAALYLDLGDDELEVAGALLGRPVEVARCRTSDLAVPAHCEIVLEAEIDTATRVAEGPVSEYHGMYERYGAGYVATVTAITRRRDAVFQVIEPGFHAEHVLIGGVAIAAGLRERLRRLVPAVRRVAVPMGGCGRLAAVVTLAPEHGAHDARQVIEAALPMVNLIKQVTVVDDDVDPWDETAVRWAVATRMRAERDIVVVEGLRTDRSEPLKTGGAIAKLGLDATRRAQDRADWTRAEPPQAARARVAPIVAAIARGARQA